MPCNNENISAPAAHASDVCVDLGGLYHYRGKLAALFCDAWLLLRLALEDEFPTFAAVLSEFPGQIPLPGGQLSLAMYVALIAALLT